VPALFRGIIAHALGRIKRHGTGPQSSAAELA
jgi:hypothetical protein